MFLSDLSIKRPVFATVMILSLVTLGLFSYRNLAVEMFPNVEMPILSIVTIQPGASPEAIERDVTRPLEEAVNPIAGVKNVVSISREGVSTVVVEFELEIRINDAIQEATARIGAIRGELPREIEAPIISKLDFGGMPIVSLAIRSERLSRRELTRLVERRIKRRLENVPGVGRIDLVGAASEAVNVEIDPARLEALGMGVDEVVAGIAQENVNLPVGRLTRGAAEYPIRIAGKPATVEGFRAMVVAERAGRPIALGEVARIEDGVEEERSLALIDGRPAIALDVLKQSGANTVAIVEEVKREIDRLRAELPPGVEIGLVRDGSTFIRDAVADVETTMIFGGFFAILIVFIFLNSWRSTVIAGITLPVAVVSTFIIMHFGGMTLNVLTLMALSLSIGMLIDDAIVVRENIIRHLESEPDPRRAASKATAEIGMAIIATSLVVIAVFVPIAFMKGIIGRFFHSFGLVISFAVVVSTFVAFTLNPMLSSLWSDPDLARAGRRGPVKRALDRFAAWFERTADRYRLVIAWALDRRGLVVLLAVVAFIFGLLLFGLLPQEFQTKHDQGEFAVNLRTSPQASIEETRERVERALEILEEFPEVDLTYVSIGAGDAGTVRRANIYVKLVPLSERTRRQDEIQAEVRARMARLAGVAFAVSEAGSPMDQRPLEISVRGDEIAVLKRLAGVIRDHMRTIPGVVDVDIPGEHVASEYRITVDRERAADLGIASGRIASTLGALIGGRRVSTFEDAEGEAREVRVRLPAALREDPRQVEDLRIAGPAGLVPLREVVRIDRGATPAEINRRNLIREMKITADLDGVAIGTAATAIREFTDRMTLPPGYRVVFGGEQEIMEESFGYIGEALVLAILFVFLILAAQFESFIAPLAIMLSLPLAIVGMAGMLLVTGDTLNIMSQIGLIMLMGIVTKNAILLVDFAQRMAEETGDRRRAIIEAGRLRLRPIVMTTAALVFGMLPLFFALGAGAEMRAPMARALVGGILTSTVLTLVVVPVVYDILCDFEAWLARKWRR